MLYRFGPYQFDTRNAQLEGPQGVITLRPMTVKLLHVLLDAAPDLVAREQLLDRIWGRQAVTTGVVSQSVRELRRALGDSAQDPVYIETRSKIGYRFAAALERVEDDASDKAAIAPTPAAPALHHAAATPARRAYWPIALAAVVVSVLIVAVLLRGETITVPSPKHMTEMHAVEIVHDGRPHEPEALRWYREGLGALATHDPVRAQERFERALQREPTSLAALAGLAQALADRGQMHRAHELAEPLREGASTLPREAQLRITAFLAQLEHRNDAALRHLTALAALNPGDSDTGMRLAALQIESGQTGEAEATLAQLETLPRVRHARLALLRARIADVRGEPTEQLAAAKLAAESPSDTPLHAEALLEQAAALLRGGDVPAATATHSALPDMTRWPVLRLRADLFAATLQRETGALAEAIEGFGHCADNAQALGLPGLSLIARREAAHAHFIAGSYDLALAQLETLEQESAALGNPRTRAGVLALTALVQQRLGNNNAAMQSTQQALATYTDIGDLAGQASARNTLGMLYARTDRHGEAQQEWEAALALFMRIGVRRGAATARSNLAIAHGQAGRTVAAREANEAALAIFRDIGATPDVARLQFNLGIQDRRAGDLIQADARLREALDGFTAIGAESFRLQAIATLAELRLLRADPAGAHALLADLDPAELAPPEQAAAIASAQARLSMLRGNMESAAADFSQARSLREHAGQADWARFSELDLAELAARRGNLSHAEQRARELRRDMAQHGDARAALQAGILLAAIRHARGDHEGSARLLDTLDKELAEQPDALLAMRLDLIRAAQTFTDRHTALAQVADRARSAGFELLALRADVIGGDEGNARTRLDELGIRMPGMPPALPY